MFKGSLITFCVCLFFLNNILSTAQPEAEKQKLFSLLSPTVSNIDFNNKVESGVKHNLLIDGNFYNGGGIAIADFNKDNLPDIFFGGNQVESQLYFNKGNLKFQNVTALAGINTKGYWCTGITTVDINADGWLDIYICTAGHPENIEYKKNLLYINNQDGTFSEKAKEYGLDTYNHTISATFFDYNSDGFMDLYEVNYPHHFTKKSKQTISFYIDNLYINNKNGFFEKKSDAYMFSKNTYSLNVIASDLNNDFDTDLFVSNSEILNPIKNGYDVPERGDLLLMNKKNILRDESLNALNHISFFSMGCDIADINNDGLLDIMTVDMAGENHYTSKTTMPSMDAEFFNEIVSNGFHYKYMQNMLQLNTGNESFSEIAQLAGISKTNWSWAPLIQDFDNDGKKDVFITTGYKKNYFINDETQYFVNSIQSLFLKDTINALLEIDEISQTKVKNHFFKNKGNLKFDKVSSSWCEELPNLSNGAAYADLDLDGDIDIVTNNLDTIAYIYENHASKIYENNFLTCKLIGSQNNLFAFGSKIKIFTENGIQYSELTTNHGFQSASEPILHFGIGQLTKIDSLQVSWSDGRIQMLYNIPINQTIEFSYKNSIEKKLVNEQKDNLFKQVSIKGLEYTHTENKFDDFEKQVLLPHKLSTQGPDIAVSDLNGDGLEDIVVGGASNFPLQVFFQEINGSFIKKEQELWQKEKIFEDIGITLFDYDNDGDNDIYVVSGGNEFPKDAPNYQDRIYTNDGKGTFSKTIHVLPSISSSGSNVYPFDYDLDGDVDLFVGGRHLPHNYPLAPESYILENNDGKFKDVTDKIAPDLKKIGMVTSATWTDFDNDNQMDLILVGEWMPITFFKNNNGSFENITENIVDEKTNGWYNIIKPVDIDNDNDIDFVVGNLGLNTKYKASSEKPLHIFADHINVDEQFDILLSTYDTNGKLVPVRGKECSSVQIPEISKKIKTYNQFALSDIHEIYGKEKIEQSNKLKAYEFRSGILMNENGKYSFNPLPIEAQFAPIQDIMVRDIDKNGLNDLICIGNFYDTEVETIRYDASKGLVLLNKKDEFVAVDNVLSGLWNDKNARSLELINIKGIEYLLIANNADKLQVFKCFK